MQTVGIRIVRILKLHLLILELLLDKLFGVHASELGKLNLFTFDHKCRQPPLPLFIVPFSLLLNFVDLLVGHQVTDHLVQKIELFGLLPDRVQQLFVFLGIFLMDILQLHRHTFVFLSELLDDFATVFNLLLERVVILFLFQ